MAGAVAARESLTIAGRPERVAVARAFAAAVLGRENRERETAVLLLSELVTNSVRHSGSRLPGQTITVTVFSDGKVIRVEVTDRSGATIPALRSGDAEAEGGRGLYLVDTLAARWGFAQDGDHTTTWFEIHEVHQKSTGGPRRTWARPHSTVRSASA
jgi:anti-sigma regulatory factor (Ser/Thr protein kinase)